MGGDTPLDYEGEICDIAGACTYEPGKELTKEKLEPVLPQVVERLESNKWGSEEIGWQVLGVLAMQHGVELSDEIKSQIVDACLEDEWAQDDEERKSKVMALKEAIERYDGTPIQITSKGLFEVMYEKLGGKSEE